MIGLLRNNFYSASGNLKTAFLVNVILMFVPIITRDGEMLFTIIAVQSFMFVANIGTGLQIDTTSKWNRFEITMPIRRKTVIDARYLSLIIMILLGILMSVITTILAYSVGISLNFERVGFGFTFGIMVALLTSAFMYPLILKFGTEKSEMLIIISAFSVGFYIITFCIRTEQPRFGFA